MEAGLAVEAAVLSWLSSTQHQDEQRSNDD